MNRIASFLVVGLLLTSGCAVFSNKPKEYTSLRQCKVAAEWVPIRDAAWNKASSKLAEHGFRPITNCKKIKIEAGIKVNPKTGQWGRPMKYPDGSDFWYAGLGSRYSITVVGTPEKAPYARAAAIMTHECGESILSSNGMPDTNFDERNKLLWSLGL